MLLKYQENFVKHDLAQLLKKIIHRNEEINNLKKIIKSYINILNNKKFYYTKKVKV